MPGNSFGNIFRLTSFGESHGPCVGGVIDGCPAGLKLDLALIARDMQRRRPGQSAVTTKRVEDDAVEILSGVFENVTTGAPIAFIIKNAGQRSGDYEQLRDIFRPSHADFTWQQKFGIRDHRGGGRSSARETAVRVAAGAVARQLLAAYGIEVGAFTFAIGRTSISPDRDVDLAHAYESAVRCPDDQAAAQMEQEISEAREKGDSLGGIVRCIIRNVPAGLGEPVFDKLHACLAHAMMSINATRGFELGSGFAGTGRRGSEENDAFITTAGGKTETRTNNSGGIQGGISNGMPIVFNVAFKPPASIAKAQSTVNRHGNEVKLEVKGRHDPCVVPRAVAVVEAMAALVIADFLLLSRLNQLAPGVKSREIA